MLNFPKGHKGKKMRLMLLMTSVFFLLVVTGCATKRELLVTGASRSDGVIKLSYERNEFQRVSYDDQKAQELAAQKCAAWGYKGAESFGSEESTCLSRRGFGNCGSRQVTVAYQCLGAPGDQQK
ncbi:YecR family lipoprotein [Xanthomonas campestris pv. raphani]|uniref:YecR family lipoprotein n=1 Tax=Xanthomonas campestris TaxID=339 RepID=UPI002B235FA8|nr:YecR family lipoprotein [Xanthomonas campestris]MEA9903801.1 YecR family lipoprotein [Xanthomonas campestris pv. raphani]